MRRALAALAVTLALLPACRRENAVPAGQVLGKAVSALPDDAAGRLVERAIDAAGGWEKWRAYRDMSYISTLTIFDPIGNAVSETIFQHRMPLHDGVKTRLESIGLGEELIFGFDGESEWMSQGGRLVSDPARTAFTRFHALSSAYWVALPFVIAELPGEVTYLGSEEDGGRTLEKIRVGYADSVPVPFDWLVVYFDSESARLERVQVHALAEFLQHSLWIGIWRDERRPGGIAIDRRRAFFPSDGAGEMIGPMAAEQLVEHVEFDRGLAPELFTHPENPRGLTTEIES